MGEIIDGSRDNLSDRGTIVESQEFTANPQRRFSCRKDKDHSEIRKLYRELLSSMSPYQAVEELPLITGEKRADIEAKPAKIVGSTRRLIPYILLAEEADREGERVIGQDIKRPSLSVVCVLVSSLVHLHDFDRDLEPREGNGQGYLAVLQSGLERLLLIAMAMAGTNGRDGVWEHGPGGVEDEVCVTPLVSLFSPFDESTLLALARHHFGRCVRCYVLG